MHLTAANLAYLLMDRGLLGADEIVAGRVFWLVDASRRDPRPGQFPTPSVDKKRWTLITFGAKMQAP